MNYCSSYCGLACVDGSCPKNQDRRYDCFECWLYAGCADCVFFLMIVIYLGHCSPLGKPKI